MSLPAPLWGFIGLFAGGWKLVIVAVALFSLFGRGLRPYLIKRVAGQLGLSPLIPTVSPTPAPSPAAPQPPARRWISDRLFVFLLVLAATALASLILGRLWIMNNSSPAAPVPDPASRTSPSEPLPTSRTGISLLPPVPSRFEEPADDDSRFPAQL